MYIFPLLRDFILYFFFTQKLIDKCIKDLLEEQKKQSCQPIDHELKPDQETTDLVYGFIHNIQKEMDLMIPSPLYLVILSYFYLTDYFESWNKEIYSLKNNNKIIKCIERRTYSSIYGNIEILSTEIEKRWIWTFKINKNIGGSIWIGISSSYTIDQDCFTNRLSSNYGLGLDGGSWSKGRSKRFCQSNFNDGDILKMIIDFKYREISYYHNNNHLGVAYDNLDINDNIKYKMAVIMAKIDNEIELIDFKCDYRNGDNDDEERLKMKNIEIKMLKEENFRLKHELTESQQILQETITNSSV